jgi:hypothetical protein
MMRNIDLELVQTGDETCKYRWLNEIVDISTVLF